MKTRETRGTWDGGIEIHLAGRANLAKNGLFTLPEGGPHVV